MQRQGLIFVISAPSGTGKTTLIKSLLHEDQHIHNAITHTTRAQRPNEKDGIHYHFVSKEDFKKFKNQGFFLETAEVYDQLYGTSKTAVSAILSQGIDVILNIEWQGARNVRSAFPDRTITIFITPPSMSELRERMIARGEQDDKLIRQRLKAAEEELSHIKEYDYRILNDNFEIAFDDLKAIIRAERLKIRN